ncbi:MAG: 16S rRNA (uracil(1498)-N(3))-methyltransferase [Nitrospirota bacterium]
MPFYFINNENRSGDTITIPLPLSHHLLHVLRYQTGDSLTLVDEERNGYKVKIIGRIGEGLETKIESKLESRLQSTPRIHLGIALLKGDRTDWAIQKGTELGADCISVLMTRHVVVKIQNDKIARQQKRWFEIAKEAAQQSERFEIPQIDPPMKFSSFLEQTQAANFKLFFWEKEPSFSSLRTAIQSKKTATAATLAILIGPEGGWAKEEVDQAIEKGYISVSLGRRLLRAETATLAALSILQYEIGK